MSQPTVETTLGTLRGTDHGGLLRFAGIPFAAPPVGALRFLPPAPPLPWTGVRSAEHHGPVVPQLPSPLDAALGAEPPVQDEADSLVLNVWTPGLAGSRPVMVWIHGGAFLNGAGSFPLYDGAHLAASGDVVVVTINYRLGAFGFLHLEEFAGEAASGSGLAGTLDQVAALEWVRDNIAAFGGDPGNVTIFGESAGAMSVNTLLGLPAAQGLFHKAIAQSGGANFCREATDAAVIAKDFLAHVGVDTLEALQALPTQAILDAQAAILQGGRLDMPFTPVVDGAHLPQQPLEALRAGLGDVPVLIGTTRDEFSLFLMLDMNLFSVDAARVAAEARGVFGDDAEALIDTYASNRPGAKGSDLLVAFMTDHIFRIPVIRVAETQHQQGRRAYMYWFTYESQVMDFLKSCHALELPFVFGTLDAGAMLTGTGSDRQALSDAMVGAWTRFARTGDPGWPAYDPTTRPVMRFDAAEPGVVHDPDAEERLLWEGRA